jgi:hypothetical protein
MTDTIERRALKWFASDDTGASSKSIANHMLGIKQEDVFGASAPCDGGDLGRCLRLLTLIPEWEPRIPEMAALSHEWAALAPHWQELKTLMIEETGPTFDRNARAPKTYERIRSLTIEARKKDGWGTFGKSMSVRMKA